MISVKKPVINPKIGPKKYPVILTGIPAKASLKVGIAVIGTKKVLMITKDTEVAIKTAINDIFLFVQPNMTKL